MADQKLSDLPALPSALEATDLVYVVRSSTDYKATGADLPTGTGDVVGPASATDGVPALFDGATGKLLKNSTPTGTGNPVMDTSPTLVTPDLGTPTAGVLTSCTGLPISTGVAGLGTGIATALAVNVGSAGAPVLLNGALGTPSSGTLTSCTGLPVSTGISGLGTGIATALAVNVGSAGAPALVNGALGTPSSGTLTNCTGLPVAGGGTGAATLAANNVLLGNGTSALQVVAPGSSGNVLTSNGTTWASTAPAGGAGTKTYAVFTPLDNQPPSSAFATLNTRNSIAILEFNDTTDSDAIFNAIMVEGASLGSGLKIRIHWVAATATSGDCVWVTSIMAMDATTDIDSDSFDTTATATTTTAGTSGYTNTTEITLTTIDSLTAGVAYRLKVTRDANAGGDTMSGNAQITAVEVRSAA